MDDKDLTLSGLAARVFVQTQEIEDVLDMLDTMIDKIFQHAEGYQKTEVELQKISSNEANGIFCLTSDTGKVGVAGFTLQRKNNQIIGRCSSSSDIFKEYNLGTRDGIAEFSKVIYEAAAEQIAGRAAVARFEARRRNKV